MSWSIYTTGTPEKVVAALNEHSARLTEPTKKEYDKALPNLIGIVEQNIGGHNGASVIVKLNASGYAHVDENGTATTSRCQTSIEVFEAYV